MRLNPQSFNKCLKTDGSYTNFWKYDHSEDIEYDATTQLPTNPGRLIKEHADFQDFTINEIKTAGGLIDINSKKIIVMPNSELEKGDEVLDSNLLETYKIVFVIQYANRKHLVANKPESSPTQHT